MVEQRRIDGEVAAGKEPGPLKRRGILAAAGALVAVLAAKAASDSTSVRATDGDIIHIGDTNFSPTTNLTATTIVTGITAAPPNASLTWENVGQSDGIRGRVLGGAAGSAGVRGDAVAFPPPQPSAQA